MNLRKFIKFSMKITLKKQIGILICSYELKTSRHHIIYYYGMGRLVGWSASPEKAVIKGSNSLVMKQIRERSDGIASF